MILETSALIGGGDQAKRSPSDFYPTPPEVTHALMLFLRSRDLSPRKVWECACGDNAMVNVIRQYTDCYGSDIRRGTDYLTTRNQDADAIITNPPFSIADKFIEKALGEADTVAFVLKTQYWHAAKRKPLFDLRRPAFILPLLWRPSFVRGKNAPLMDVIWTVWTKDATITEFIPLDKPNLKTMPAQVETIEQLPFFATLPTGNNS